MTPLQMKYFDAVCQYKSISKAAAVLHITQPTITVAIKSLEKEIGINLFYRQGKHLVLTREGTIIWDKINPVLSIIEQLEKDVKDVAHNKNHIRLAIPPQIGVKLLPKILGDFKKFYPDIRLEICEFGGIAALQMLENDEIDLAITNYHDDFSPNLRYQKIGENEICFCTYPTNRFSDDNCVSIGDIGNEPLVMLDGNFFVNRVINMALNKAKVSPNILQYTSQLHTVKNLVSNGLASTFLMRQAISADDTVIPISLRPKYFINSGIVYKKNRTIYSDERYLINFLQDNYSKQIDKWTFNSSDSEYNA